MEVAPIPLDYSSTNTTELEIDAKHLKATKADDAKVDLTMWALPKETLKESWA